MHYRSQLIKKLLPKLVSEENEKINVKEACDVIVAAWWSVKESTIIKCWRKASVLTNDDLEVETTAIETTGVEVEREIREMWDSIIATTGVLDIVNYEDYIEADDNLLTASELTDQEIIEHAQACSSNVDITFESEDE
jgi:hypothetical protein